MASEYKKIEFRIYLEVIFKTKYKVYKLFSALFTFISSNFVCNTFTSLTYDDTVPHINIIKLACKIVSFNYIFPHMI
jgi:hypothetical protein